MKNLFQDFKNKFKQAEERTSKLKVRSIKVIQSEVSEKKMKKIEKSPRHLWDTIKYTNIRIVRVPEEKERE